MIFRAVSMPMMLLSELYLKLQAKLACFTHMNHGTVTCLSCVIRLLLCCIGAVLLRSSGPLVGGVLSDHFGWRSTFIFTTCMAGAVILPLLLLFLPGELHGMQDSILGKALQVTIVTTVHNLAFLW
jgi:MFS family permease